MQFESDLQKVKIERLRTTKTLEDYMEAFEKKRAQDLKVNCYAIPWIGCTVYSIFEFTVFNSTPTYILVGARGVYPCSDGLPCQSVGAVHTCAPACTSYE